LSSAYSVFCLLALLPAIKQSLTLSLPAKATDRCQAVQGDEIFHAGRRQETHLVGAIIKQHKGEERRVGENADGVDGIFVSSCNKVVIFSAHWARILF
jgi:hypothetical protein